MAQQPPGERIPYDIVYCSSEDEPFPVTELLKPDDAPGHRGWQTAKNPKYPQSLVLRFNGDVELQQIQILSHECKIPSKVEVRVFSLSENAVDVRHDGVIMPSFRDARFVKLGSVGFNTNEKSKYRSKERKTVHLKAVAYFLKLNFQRCHANAFNTNQQVGIYSVVCYGFPSTSAPYHIDHPLTRQQHSHLSHDDAVSPSAMSEHGLPPIHGAVAGAHRGANFQQGGRFSPPPVHHQTSPPHVKQQQHGADVAAYNYATPNDRPLDPSPVMYSAAAYADIGFKSPPQKHHTAHPHDVPTIPEPVASSSGYTYRSQSILNFELIYAGRTAELVSHKAQAVDEEDFDTAKTLKDALKHLHDVAHQVYDMEREKVRCIYDEDFDGAKRAKVEMDALLDAVFRTIPSGFARFLEGSSAVASRSAAPPAPTQRSAPRGNSKVVDLPPIDPTRVVKNASKHNFEDEPVRSKYAIAMAQRREEHPSDDEHEEAAEGGQQDAESDPPPDADPATTSDTYGDGNDASQQQQPDDDDGAALSGAPAVVDAFEVSSLPKWEQDVYRAIHSIAQEDAPAVPVQATGAHTEAAECIRVLGSYTTACLLSKRWKLREAAIRALSQNLTGLYQHIPTANVLLIVLKFFDIKGCGLQDTIGNVFLACCEFVQFVLQDKFDGTLATVLPAVLNLLPRFVARAGDAAQKTREEAAATVVAYVICSEVGVHHVASVIIADPIDQDKRRIPTQNHRVQLARLALLQQLLLQFKLTLNPTMFDSCMSKLMIPCLNHSSNEVRDLAVSVCTTLIEASSTDVGKYLSAVSNSAIRTQLTTVAESKGSLKPAAQKRNNSAGKGGSDSKTRNTSAPRKARPAARPESEVPPDD